MKKHHIPFILLVFPVLSFAQKPFVNWCPGAGFMHGSYKTPQLIRSQPWGGLTGMKFIVNFKQVEMGAGLELFIPGGGTLAVIDYRTKMYVEKSTNDWGLAFNGLVNGKLNLRNGKNFFFGGVGGGALIAPVPEENAVRFFPGLQVGYVFKVGRTAFEISESWRTQRMVPNYAESYRFRTFYDFEPVRAHYFITSLYIRLRG